MTMSTCLNRLFAPQFHSLDSLPLVLNSFCLNHTVVFQPCLIIERFWVSAKIINKQECIPVGCVLSAAVTVFSCHAPPPTHTPTAMHAPCHTCHLSCMPPPYMPPAMHTLPLPCMSPSPHTLLVTHTPPHHACPFLATHAPFHHTCPPPLHHARPLWTDSCLWKHFLSATTVADGNKIRSFLF